MMETIINKEKQDYQKAVLKSSYANTYFSAIRTPHYHLTENEIIRFMENEATAKDKIGNLLKKRLGNGVDGSETENTYKKNETFDISKFV